MAAAACGGEEGGDAEALFEADDAVLIAGGVATHGAGEQEEGDGHDDVPELELGEGGPGAIDEVDGEEDVEEEDLDEEEVEGGVEAGVVLIGLRSWHGGMINQVMRGPAGSVG